MKDQILQIKEKQHKAAKALSEIDQLIGPMEREIDQIFTQKWNEMFPGIEDYHIVSLLGSHTIDWEPAIYIYNINNVVSVEGGRWAKGNEGVHNYYAHSIAFVECPVDINRLQEFMEFIEEVAVPVELVEKKIQTVETIDRVRNIDDLQCRFGPFEVLQNEKVWYLGWDIADSFVIGKYPGGHIEIWYSNNGHGFGYDVHVQTGETIELERFYNYLETNDVSSKVPKEEVLKSWEVV
jgi:hypothetical protein